jgi:heptosyltransferase III
MPNLTNTWWLPIRRRLGKIRRGFEAVIANTPWLLRRSWTRARSFGQALAISINASRRRTVVLIGLIEHLGDIVACEPIARFARSRDPEAYIVWCVRPPYRELLTHNPYIDQVIVTQSLTEWKDLVRLRPFDKVIDLHFVGRPCGMFGGNYEKNRGDASVTIYNYYHNYNLLAAYCKSAGLPVLNDGPRVYISAQVRVRVDRLNLPRIYCVVHCSSNERSRGWATEKWHALAEQIGLRWGAAIVEIGTKPVVVSGNGYLDLCGKLTILETAEVIRRASLFIGIDSGPAHLANATATPGIILLGKYRNFDRYLPYSGKYATGENVDLIYSDDTAAAIPVAEVLDKVARHMLIAVTQVRCATTPLLMDQSSQ